MTAKKNIIRYFYGLLVMVLMGPLFQSCEEVPDSDVAELPLPVQFVRTDSLQWACSKALIEDSTLQASEAYHQYLGGEKEFFFRLMGLDQPFQGQAVPDQVKDTMLIQELAINLDNANLYKLLDTVQEVFPDQAAILNHIGPPLKRMAVAFEEIGFPEFRTHVSGYNPNVDWRGVDQIVSAPGYVSIGLHYFLGEDLPYYPPNVPQFQRRRCRPDYMAVMLMHEIAEEMVAQVDPSSQPRLIDKAIRAGIKQYFLQEMLPYTPDSLRLWYTDKQMEWALIYEQRIYKSLAEKLYSVDFLVHRDYLTDKPYTTQLAQESAPRIAEFFGWKVVQAYMKRHPEESLATLCARRDYLEIFQEAKYKP